MALAAILLAVDRSGDVPNWLITSAWLYSGGGTGARTLLGAVASSTIGVAGTVFSITIASLSLAAGQMGPRLLRAFTRDRGNQITLGVFLGTFSYALLVLRSVRTGSEGAFVPNLSLSVGVGLAFLCVGTLVYFVGHSAHRINVDEVIDLVMRDIRKALTRLTVTEAPLPPGGPIGAGASPVIDTRFGYLQELDTHGLADWAAAHGTTVHMLVRPGDAVFPGAPIAFADPLVDGVAQAVADATALGAQRVSADDLEYAVRQLVEVGVRALSPGINDPNTAISVLDRLGEALCDIRARHLPNGVYHRGGRPALVVPAIDYDGLVDAMFHMLRQNAAGSTAVLIRLLDILCWVASADRAPARLATLERHANLTMHDAERDVETPGDLADIRRRHARFAAVMTQGALALAGVSAVPAACRAAQSSA